MKTVLQMENIEKRFGARQVLKGISLELCEGETAAVIGPSGSGKTTLLRVAALLERADGGSLRYLGQTAAHAARYAPRKELRACAGSFGMVFQGFELFPHRSVLQNVADAPVYVKKTPRKAAEERAMALLERVGLTERAGDYPYRLSGGEKQRVCIARALAMEPQMLFFDEPTSALDPESTRGVLGILRGLAESRMTLLIVTHEMAFARAAADRVIFMEDGRVVEAGSAAAVLDAPQNARTRAFLTGGLSCATM